MKHIFQHRCKHGWLLAAREAGSGCVRLAFTGDIYRGMATENMEASMDPDLDMLNGDLHS